VSELTLFDDLTVEDDSAERYPTVEPPVAPTVESPVAPTLEPAPTVEAAPDDESSSFPVRVIRSAKRRRTAQAQLIDGVIHVRVPARISKAEETRLVADLVARLEKREHRKTIDLAARASELARRFGVPLPASIRFVENQHKRWGSCTINSGDIRISSNLARYPAWVLDYVILHELAHLVVPDHSPEFHAIVAQYPKAERAKGYLQAKSDGI
jgi:predicted metal-dependent hydrolase